MPSEEKRDIASSTPHRLGRRGFLSLVGVAAVAGVVDSWGFGSFPNAEGSLSQRSQIFSTLLKEVVSAKISGNEQKQDQAEKTFYLWTVCNAMELGARFGKGYLTAANCMRHFLYGDGSPVDLSKTFQAYLRAEYASPAVGTKDWDKGPVGIGNIISDQVNARHEGLKLTKINSAEQLVNMVFEDGEQSQEDPLLCGSGLSLESEHNNHDWNVAVGLSTVETSFELAGKNYRLVVDPRDPSKYLLLVLLKSYDVRLTDRYDWHAPSDIPVSSFTEHLLKQLTGKKDGSFEKIKAMIDAIGRKFFPNGPKEADINLLVEKGWPNHLKLQLILRIKI